MDFGDDGLEVIAEGGGGEELPAGAIADLGDAIALDGDAGKNDAVWIWARGTGHEQGVAETIEEILENQGPHSVEREIESGKSEGLARIDLREVLVKAVEFGKNRAAGGVACIQTGNIFFHLAEDQVIVGGVGLLRELADLLGKGSGLFGCGDEAILEIVPEAGRIRGNVGGSNEVEAKGFVDAGRLACGGSAAVAAVQNGDRFDGGFRVTEEQTVFFGLVIARRRLGDFVVARRELRWEAGVDVVDDVEKGALTKDDVVAAAIDGVAGFDDDGAAVARIAIDSEAADDAVADKIAIVELVFVDDVLDGGFEVLIVEELAAVEAGTFETFDAAASGTGGRSATGFGESS